ncbi:MAG: ribonucleoside-triphosphate reductase, adenosylcobalamin-dependent [Synechococcus sp. SB0676_bin_10]|uniref:Ribonucleoside-triphosphate reductase, adenosylcobalamin-dependent n=1 Tax=Synechococcus sp. SB0676_bin_10 TaxID=2604869 RepID=A0A6B1F686_9SYNE|nr:ribonucleoside-triphosphate reductase, adenosylcobalamin-dependent [Synechococcus sp. SB0676_bin_10]
MDTAPSLTAAGGHENLAPASAAPVHTAPSKDQMAFPDTAPAACPVFIRSYSRRLPQARETSAEVTRRTGEGLVRLGQLRPDQVDLLRQQQAQLKALPAGRWLWIGGTPWVGRPENFSGAYNCTSTNLVDWDAFALMMDLAMMGCGTGAVIEPHHIQQLPPILNRLRVVRVTPIGQRPPRDRQETTTLRIQGSRASITVGDSRQGWVEAYRKLLCLASDGTLTAAAPLQITVDLGHVRPVGEPLKGFGGVANPVKLQDLFGRVATILNGALGRQLNSVECCLLIDEAAVTIVAGNIRRSAGMRQFAAEDALAAGAKDNLWQQGPDGSWRINPERDALRMANHTRVFHGRPTNSVKEDAVRRQYHSGEGAIQFAPEAIARANADLLTTAELRQEFVDIYCDQGRQEAAHWLELNHGPIPSVEMEHRLSRYGLNPCGEIIGSDFHCNLSEVHLNLISPQDRQGQEKAFQAAALAAAVLLKHRFVVERYQHSRELDPIVGVSFTGLFDFFVHAFGAPWLHWWLEGRPRHAAGRRFLDQEAEFLRRWSQVVQNMVEEYCKEHGLRVPNRCTTVQPAGTKSLLTGASPGWHPPKSQRFIRRITFRKNDPVALACMDYGYAVVPSQTDKDDQGRLLDDPFDPRCTEWLVEIPTAVSWANLPGADQVDLSRFSATAQFDFYMQVQRFYTGHNTSATIELREEEIHPLAEAIHQAIHTDGGYISAALLARFDANATFPRLPFEPISKAVYDQLHAAVLTRRRQEDFFAALQRHDHGGQAEAGPMACDSDKCLMPEKTP